VFGRVNPDEWDWLASSDGFHEFSDTVGSKALPAAATSAIEDSGRLGREAATMKVTCVYADEDGESHFRDWEITLADGGPIGYLSEPMPARSVIFRKNEPGYDYDWHVAPRRQLIVLLDGGGIEVEVSDGERRRLGSGELLLVEDTTGKGHRTRNIEPRERHSLFIVLAEAESGGDG
jgi:hypothetical protein